MFDSAGAAKWIAQIAFWWLVIVGWRELGGGRRIVFIGLWLLGLVCRDYVPYGPAIFTAYVSVLAVALVLLIYKRDIPLY
jgi:hypothetical protein